MTTTQPSTNQPSQNEIIGSQIKIPNKLSPLFGPNDFYYYNAQFPMGINFLGSVIGINFNDSKYTQYTKNFDVNNPTINTTINGATYSIPYPLIKSKCNDPDTLLNDISNALNTFFKNEGEKSDEYGNATYDDANIKYGSPNSIIIEDNKGVTHTYYPNGTLDNSNYINFNQNVTDNSFYGDVSMNVVNNFNNSPYKYVNDSSSSYNIGTTYYQTLNADSNGKQCISNSINDFNNCCILTNGTYNSCTIGSSQIIQDPQSPVDLFVKNLQSMSFDVFPNYSSVNTYSMSDLYNKQSSGTVYDPNSSVLVQKIADYYIALCENAEKAIEYQKVVNGVYTSNSDEVYQQSQHNYYREYERIFNISVGILIAMGALYNISL